MCSEGIIKLVEITPSARKLTACETLEGKLWKVQCGGFSFNYSRVGGKLARG